MHDSRKAFYDIDIAAADSFVSIGLFGLQFALRKAWPGSELVTVPQAHYRLEQKIRNTQDIGHLPGELCCTTDLMLSRTQFDRLSTKSSSRNAD
jgi:hypothetical protein